jgi:hypothetical protein
MIYIILHLYLGDNMESHGIDKIIKIQYISDTIRNRVFSGLIISSKCIRRKQVILKVRWSNGEITNVDLRDFCYIHKGQDILYEYQNSIIATELIKIIKDHNTKCKSDESCIGYIRVSSQKDLERDCSIEQQLLNLVEFAKSKNFKIYNVLIHNGVSGGPAPGNRPCLRNYGLPYNLSRRDFQLFMGDFTITNGTINPQCFDSSNSFFKDNNIKALYVTNVGRLTRSVHGFRMIYEFCKHYNIVINSGLTCNYDNPPLDSRIDRNKMFNLAMEAEIQHIDFCISAQNAFNTRKRNRDMDEQNPEASEDVGNLEEAMDLVQVNPRPRNRQRRSHSAPAPRENATDADTSMVSSAMSSASSTLASLASRFTGR